MPAELKTPRVFVSSTAEDLEAFRQAAQQALKDSDCHAVMFEYWEGADNPPLDECLERVGGCDLVLAVVAERHGWTPPNQEPGEFKSITRLECERAVKQGTEVIPFLLDDKTQWPKERTENYRLTLAADRKEFDTIPALSLEIQRNQDALEDFEQWLTTGRQRRLFSTPDNLRYEIARALDRWRSEHPAFQRAHAVAGFDRGRYRDWLRRHCESVELLGLDQRETYNVRLQHVYVPAMVSWRDPPPEMLEARKDTRIEGERTDAPQAIDLPLTDRLGYESLYVPGAPGSGKSTFCRWLALITTSGQVPPHRIPTSEEYVESLPAALEGRLPVLCYLRDFNDHKDLLHGSGRWTRKEFEQALGDWRKQSYQSA